MSTNNVIQFPARLRVVSDSAATAAVKLTALQRSIETIRTTGIAAMKGNPLAREVLGLYAKITGEPRIAEAAQKFVRAIEEREVMAPRDVEQGGAA